MLVLFEWKFFPKIHKSLHCIRYCITKWWSIKSWSTSLNKCSLLPGNFVEPMRVIAPHLSHISLQAKSFSCKRRFLVLYMGVGQWPSTATQRKNLHLGCIVEGKHVQIAAWCWSTDVSGHHGEAEHRQNTDDPAARAQAKTAQQRPTEDG